MNTQLATFEVTLPEDLIPFLDKIFGDSIDQKVRLAMMNFCCFSTSDSHPSGNKVRTRFSQLISLGIGEGKAWEFANTRKGYWRISNSPIFVYNSK